MMTVVPAKRLLWLAGLVAVPLLTVLGMMPQLTAPIILLLLGLACWTLWDARQSRVIVNSLQLRLPARINLFMQRPDAIELHLSNSDQRARTIRIALNLPAEIESESEDIVAQLPAGVEHLTIDWPCRAKVRGQFFIPSIHLELSSRRGFWDVRTHRKVQTEVRVYPDLLPERKSIAAVFLRHQTAGLRAQRLVGKGRDFEKLRDYLPGDPMEDVHWKATAKRNRLVTKIFQVERTQQVYVAIDCSRLTNRPSSSATPNITTLDRFVTTALLLALATEENGDHFGLITFSNEVHSIIRARNGQSHFALCRDALFTLEPRLVTPDYDELFSSIRMRLRKRALIVLLTPLDDPLLAESFTKSIELVSRQHLLLVNMIEPGRIGPIFKSLAATEAAVYDSLAGHLLWQKLREVEKKLSARGVRFSVLPNEKLASEMVSQYLTVKQRQIL